jgi:hypothetical protein
VQVITGLNGNHRERRGVNPSVAGSRLADPYMASKVFD